MSGFKDAELKFDSLETSEWNVIQPEKVFLLVISKLSNGNDVFTQSSVTSGFMFHLDFFLTCH